MTSTIQPNCRRALHFPRFGTVDASLGDPHVGAELDLAGRKRLAPVS